MVGGEGRRARRRARAARGVAVSTAVAVLAAHAACAREAPEPRRLVLERFRQAGVEGVLLNEPLLWIFGEELDRASVTRESVRLTDEAGASVPGRFSVEGRRLRFHPRLPREPDVGDGSFRPGARYRVELAGFPRPDALRARDGAPLAASRLDTFRVATAGRGDRLFEDPRLGPPAPLELASSRVRADEPIVLRAAEPIDPASLPHAELELHRFVEGPAGASGGRFERVPIDVRLADNTRDEAIVELRPAPDASGRRPSFAPGSYHLWIDPARPGLTDLSGHPMPTAWALATGGPVAVTVTAPAMGAPEGVFDEDFVDPTRLAALPPPGADGTLAIARGGLTLAWPAAAGSGADGAVVLDGDAPRSDVHATHLVVPHGALARCTAAGLVTLRAQGALEVDGRLERRTEQPPRTWRDGESPREWHERLRVEGLAEPEVPLEHRPGETLSEWLERARAREAPWTVLVAGGDLWVRGEVRVDGPLVLVAGGWVRATGSVTARQIWKSERGGGVNLAPDPVALPVALDEPVLARFAAPLVFGAWTAPIRPPGGVARWRGARAWTQGAGLAVRYVGEREHPGGRLETLGPVDDPRELGDAPALRIVVECRVDAAPDGARWQAPFVDRVEVLYDPLWPTSPAAIGGAVGEERR